MLASFVRFCFLCRMARARWIVPWADSETKPAIYHCIARVVDKRFAFGPEDKEQFRIYMRMMENFSGCRVLAYCVMCNHFHLLLEVPPRPKVALTDEQLLKRLGALYSQAFVATVAKELAEARQVVAQGLARDGEAYVQRIHERFTYRMHDLSEFMKTLAAAIYALAQQADETVWELVGGNVQKRGGGGWPRFKDDCGIH